MKIKANGISMNYELSGGMGRYFTLIHGAGDNLNEWYNQVPAFSRHYRVLTYDVRGHGQTELPDGELTTELWVEDLHALLRALNINETILLGFSMGGAIALGFTLAHPRMVSALILSNSGVGGTARRSEEEMRQMAARRQAELESVKTEGMSAVVRDRLGRMFSPGFVARNPATAERYKEILLQNTPERYLRVMQRIGRPAAPPDLSKITCPTLIIAGEHDPFSGPAAAKVAQEAIRGAQVRVFPTGHPSALEQPEAYNAAVLQFLSEAGLGQG